MLADDAAAFEGLVRRGDVREWVHAVHHRAQRSRGDVVGQGAQHGGLALKVRTRRAPYTLDAAIAARAGADSPTVTIRPPLANQLGQHQSRTDRVDDDVEGADPVRGGGAVVEDLVGAEVGEGGA